MAPARKHKQRHKQAKAAVTDQHEATSSVAEDSQKKQGSGTSSNENSRDSVLSGVEGLKIFKDMQAFVLRIHANTEGAPPGVWLVGDYHAFAEFLDTASDKPLEALRQYNEKNKPRLLTGLEGNFPLKEMPANIHLVLLPWIINYLRFVFVVLAIDHAKKMIMIHLYDSSEDDDPNNDISMTGLHVMAAMKMTHMDYDAGVDAAIATSAAVIQGLETGEGRVDIGKEVFAKQIPRFELIMAIKGLIGMATCYKNGRVYQYNIEAFSHKSRTGDNGWYNTPQSIQSREHPGPFSPEDERAPARQACLWAMFTMLFVTAALVRGWPRRLIIWPSEKAVRDLISGTSSTTGRPDMSTTPPSPANTADPVKERQPYARSEGTQDADTLAADTRGFTSKYVNRPETPTLTVARPIAVVISGQQGTYQIFFDALNARYKDLTQLYLRELEQVPPDQPHINKLTDMCGKVFDMRKAFTDWLSHTSTGATLDLALFFQDVDKSITDCLGEDWNTVH